MLLLIACLYAACKPHRQPERAMYYWRTSFAPTPAEDSFVLRHRINKLYVKYLDIGWTEKGGALPLSITRFPSFDKTNPVYSAIYRAGGWVPVVYITNDCFLHLPNDSLPALVQHLLTAVEKQMKSQQATLGFLKELQVDCDWSKASHERYFHFLTLLKQALKPRNIALSVTLRLHQYKYPVQTGVPPVERCMLMLYNMGKVERLSEVNSIYSDSLAGLYINQVKPYPLPLDAVVPLYSWLTIYRGKQLLTLNRRYQPAMLEDENLFRRQTGWYVLRRDTVLSGSLYRTGDVFKPERIGRDELLQATRRVRQVWNGLPTTLALYDLDENQVNHFDDETIDRLFTDF